MSNDDFSPRFRELVGFEQDILRVLDDVNKIWSHIRVHLKTESERLGLEYRQEGNSDHLFDDDEKPLPLDQVRAKEKDLVLKNNVSTFLELPEWEGVDGTLFMTLNKNVEGKKQTRTISVNQEGNMLLDRLIAIPQETQPSENFFNISEASFKDVFDTGLGLFKRHLYFTIEGQHEILVLSAMSTYYRDMFYAFPYIDLMSPHYGCGKTTGMMCVCWASAYGSCVTDPTAAVIYRYIEDSHAVLGFDELDNTLQNPDTAKPILAILNASYRRGLPCPRVDTNTNEVRFYDAFGQKVFTHVKPIPPSLINRSIVFHMVQSPKDIEEVKSPEQFEEFRDRMYWLKLHQEDIVKKAFEYVNRTCGLKNRGKEKFLPILTIAYCVGPEVYQKTKDYAVKYMAGSLHEGFDEWHVTLIEACKNVLQQDNLNGDRKREVKLVDITNEFNILATKRDLLTIKEDGSAREVRSRTIKRMLESYNIYPTPRRTDGYVHIMLDADKVMPWMTIYSSDTSFTSFTSLNNEVTPLENEDNEDNEALEGEGLE